MNAIDQRGFSIRAEKRQLLSVVRLGAALAIFAALSMAAKRATAQIGAIESDSLAEVALDHNGTAAAPDVALTPPALFYPIPEGPNEAGGTFPFMAREINFLEPVNGTVGFSDRLSVSRYEIGVKSDVNPGGLTPRSGAVKIPASALERFRPFWIEAHSDGEQTSAVNLGSDRLKITLGSYGAGTGITLIDQVIPEPLPEGPEPPLTVTIPPMAFDVYEPAAETGGLVDVVSDYVNILTPITVTFISTDDPAIIANLPLANGSVLENIERGGGVSIGLNFRSDAVPEPASLALVGIALVGVRRLARRRAC